VHFPAEGGPQAAGTVNGECYSVRHGMIRTPSAAAVCACAADGIAGQGLSGPAIVRCPAGMPSVGGMRGVSAGDGRAMPKKQTTAAKKARAAAREGEKYTTALRRQLPPGAGPGPGAAHSMSLEHRTLWNHALGSRPFRGTGLFERIGGQPTVDALVDLLYSGISADGQLRPLFPRDLAAGRSMQKVFFAEWLGGPRHYSAQAYAGLGQRHADVPITGELADLWLGHFRRAVEAAVAAEADRRTIFAQARAVALALVSRPVAPGTSPRWPVAWCGKGARILTRARDLARRGDAAGLDAVLAEAPDLLLPSFAAAIMQAAALAGRADVVRMLLERGAGANHPFYLPVNVTGLAFERVVFVTPLCAARMKRRPAVLRHGADPNARDGAGRTPLDWLDQAAPSVSKPAVQSLIERGTAGGRPSP
jgi:truncated hemoglobin YjbI